MGRVMAVVSIHSAPPHAIAWLRARPIVGLEMLALLASLFFTLCCNFEFWHNLTTDLHAHWRLLASLFVLVTALQAFLLGLVLTRWTAKPLLALLFVATAFAAYYMSTYKVYLDPDMIRNVLNTDPREAGELVVPGLVAPLLGLAVLPLLALWRIRVRKRGWQRALGLRLAFLAAMLLLGLVAEMASFKDLSALVRNQREVRYLVTPANYVVSLSGAARQPSRPCERADPDRRGCEAATARRRHQATPAGIRARRNSARAGLGAGWLCAPDHPATRGDA